MKNAELYLGDSLVFLPTLANKSVQCAISDPPYGVAFSGKRTKHAVSRSNVGYSEATEDTPELITNVVIPIFKLCLEKFGRAAIFPGTRHMFAYPQAYDVGGVFCPNGAGYGRWGYTCFTPILYYGKCPNRNTPNAIRMTGSTEKQESIN